ncbi:unnamed protein product [Clonostachys chloroleuca]|uniref:Uncharacterized protein n=1 Tax=Clonostachys chloroleuca TaxID=1926264 RepID=A0AA35Q608_9HYPO|nr:unnamed protein product [Clonostachys chloroleuca]
MAVHEDPLPPARPCVQKEEEEEEDETDGSRPTVLRPRDEFAPRPAVWRIKLHRDEVHGSPGGSGRSMRMGHDRSMLKMAPPAVMR